MGVPDEQAEGWRVRVDEDRCIGSGICTAVAPRRFRLVGGVSRPVADLIEPDEAARDAADSCPVEAISVRGAVSARLVAPDP